MNLPDFPWDALAPYKKTASAYPGGLVDLSIGTPVDSSPISMQRALAEGANAPGYPLTIGSSELRQALERWIRARYLTDSPDALMDFLPTIGSKELVGLLPTFLQARKVLIPEIAYPTYRVGALVAGAEVVPVSDDLATWPVDADLLWINSPANPHGRVLGAAELRGIIQWARKTNTVLASDECYIELGWESEPVSLLQVCAGDTSGLLIVHSLSKSFSAAGYRAAFIAGDLHLIKKIREVRKHLGLIMPAPIQRAMAAALLSPEDIASQKERYRARREKLAAALTIAGFEISHSEAGLYLWVSRGEECWKTVGWAAERGILVTPGEFYGERGANFVRVALTATDDDISRAVERLSSHTN
jgi:succinyldiaminopimelate transaminase